MEADTTNPKSAQFQEELNELLKKYQYTLVPELAYTKKGVIPQIMIRDTIPPKGQPQPTVEVDEAAKPAKEIPAAGTTVAKTAKRGETE